MTALTSRVLLRPFAGECFVMRIPEERGSYVWVTGLTNLASDVVVVVVVTLWRCGGPGLRQDRPR